MFLHVENISKNFNRNIKKNGNFNAINNISVSINSGDFSCITGRSGSGKTTFLNIIAGILKPSSGKVFIDNTNIHELDDQKSSFFRNQTIGYMPQSGSLLSNLTAIENICLPYYLYSKQNSPILGNYKNCEEKAIALLKEVKIEYLKNVYPSSMSGGEMRRVAILRALICSPRLIIADEPTNDLDESSAHEIMSLFAKINKNGTTIILVTHDQDILSYANRRFTMSDGKMLEI